MLAPVNAESKREPTIVNDDDDDHDDDDDDDDYVDGFVFRTKDSGCWPWFFFCFCLFFYYKKHIFQLERIQ